MEQVSTTNPNHTADQTLLDYYRIAPDSLACTATTDRLSGDIGFFQFGAEVCYGRCQSGTTPDVAKSPQFDASKGILREGAAVRFPFSFAEVVDNLRLEHYRQSMIPQEKAFAKSELARKLYHFIRSGLPIPVRRHLQRAYLSDWQGLPFPAWPVDFTVDILHQEFLRLLMEASGPKRVPFIWFWPKGAASCLIMTHDVETSAGRDFTPQLMDLDDSYGIKASFQVIPERRYGVSDLYISDIRRRGFEFGSPPPTRAAIVISRITLVNARPRLASVAAFLCLIVAHLECPDIEIAS